MINRIESGLLIGRPFGGVMIMINNDLRRITRTIHCSDRYAIVEIGNYIIVDIYLPCVGTPDRLMLCQDILVEIWSWCERYFDHEILIAGDFNINLDNDDELARFMHAYCTEHSLIRCDNLFPSAKAATFVNESLSQHSQIDYMLTSSPKNVISYEVIEPDINFSDHLPISGIFINHASTLDRFDKPFAAHVAALAPTQLRWDHADLLSFYEFTRGNLMPILDHINATPIRFGDIQTEDIKDQISQTYKDIINVLTTGTDLYVPRHRKNFYKFWWDQELDILKAASIESNQLWKSAGKPRHGPIFDKRQSCRFQYRKKIRENQQMSSTAYTNDLHEALLNKNGTEFWKCWRSKFESSNRCCEVDGHVDGNEIAAKFQEHFSKLFASVDNLRASELHEVYLTQRASYIGFPLLHDSLFDVELVSKIIATLDRGKAADLDGLTAEHLQYCHPILISILTKLFNQMLTLSYIPPQFCHSYTVPLPKIRDCRTTSMTCDDFRGIAISAILSKVFERCILERFNSYFLTNDNQFGFKKNLSCSHAIFTVNNIVGRFISGGATANLCAIDLSKAFDKVNHHALLIKLMRRHLPTELLDTLEFWLNHSWTCVKWFDAISDFLR